MKRPSIFELLIVIVVLIIATLKWTTNANNNDLLDKNSKATVGLVYETYTTFPENKSIKYKYVVGNKFYTAKTQNATTYRHCFVDTNDKFKVEYSPTNHNISRLVLTCKLADTLKLGTNIDTINCVDCY